MTATLKNFGYHCATVLFGVIFIFAFAVTISGWNDAALLGSRLRRVIAIAVVVASLGLTFYVRILRRRWLRREGLYLSLALFRAYYDEQVLGLRGLGRLFRKYSIGEPPVLEEYRNLFDDLSSNTITEAEFRRRVDELIGKR